MELVEIDSTELEDVVGGGWIRNGICAAGIAIGLASPGHIAIGAFGGPSAPPTAVTCPVGRQ